MWKNNPNVPNHQPDGDRQTITTNAGDDQESSPKTQRRRDTVGITV